MFIPRNKRTKDFREQIHKELIVTLTFIVQDFLKGLNFEGYFNESFLWGSMSENVESDIISNIILAFPDKPWNWLKLSDNPNITWDIIKANKDKQWNWN